MLYGPILGRIIPHSIRRVCISLPSESTMKIASIAGLSCAALLSITLPALAQNELPEGNGKDVVAAQCTQCHQLNRVTRAGYTREEWQRTLTSMVAYGAKLTPDQIAVMTDYLAKNFPDKSPKAVVIPGPAEVSIKEWQVPTPNSRPHDPMVAPDGYIWYTGQMADVLGRFDPK